ncbi:uncharacterized protein [Amphiura filiformis]|uniref:uncharacterized protein n=1 Tax=Amphiura filiformis TaxID=82378 RepID=UPI003B2111B0
MAPKSQICSILHKCKYCRRRFTGINGGYRFYSHLRHHELNIKPYWYKKQTTSISKMKQETEEILSARSHASTKGPTDSRSALKLRFSLQKEEKNLTYKVTLVESETQVTNALRANDEAGVSDSPSNREKSIDQLESHQENLNPRPRSRNVSQKSVNMKDRTNVEDISKASTGANERPAHRHCGDTCQSSRAYNGKTSNEGKPAKKRYHCRYCPRCFSQNGGLVIHERIHLGHTPFTCDICDVSFYDKSNLRKHQRTHNGNKIYKCQFCDKSFSDGSNLKKHENSHTLKKTFKCSYCDRLLTSKAGKQNHELIHTGLKPFPCSFCGRNFRFQRDLLNHNRLHTGERPISVIMKIAMLPLFAPTN